MPQPQEERRAAQRFAFELPVILKHPLQGEIHTRTRNLSTKGICFYLQTPLPVGSSLQFTMTLPVEMTLTEPVRVRCFGHVVRMENDDTGAVRAGAAAIDRFDFLTPAAPNEAA
jgi:hypothetical protein